MNWNEVMVWAVSGVIVAAVIAALHKKGKIGRIPGIVLFLVLIVGGNALYAGLIKPRMQGDEQTQEIDQTLSALPIYSTIKAQEPALYSQIRSNILRLKKEGKSQQEAIDTVKPMVSDLLSRRINTAPDVNVIAAMKVSLEEMLALQARNDGSCFKFLYPQINGGINTAQVLSPELFKKDLDTMNTLLLASGSGQTAQPTVVSGEKAKALMAPVRQALQDKYGDKLQMFNELSAENVDHAKVCDISITLYTDILALPAQDSAAVLRLMLGKQG
ncbi:MAG: hypothetical protein ACOH2G_07785 [Ewingella sp.]